MRFGEGLFGPDRHSLSIGRLPLVHKADELIGTVGGISPTFAPFRDLKGDFERNRDISPTDGCECC